MLRTIAVTGVLLAPLLAAAPAHAAPKPCAWSHGVPASTNVTYTGKKGFQKPSKKYRYGSITGRAAKYVVAGADSKYKPTGPTKRFVFAKKHTFCEIYVKNGKLTGRPISLKTVRAKALTDRKFQYWGLTLNGQKQVTRAFMAYEP